MEQPEYYQYDLDLPEVAEVWRRGSVIGSWLLDLTAASMRESADLSDFSGRVSDSGEGRWTSIAAIDEGVPAPVLTAALYERFSSRGLDDFGDKVLSAMRKQFGGHDEKKSCARGADPRGRSPTRTGRGASAAADLIAAAGREAVDERGSFSLAVSGGRTPWAMLAILSDREEMPWAETSLFQVDERVASPGSEDRNLTHIVLGLSMENQAAMRPMPVTQRDLEAAAREYEESLPERLDLVHLGLGPDGHTASLVPGDPVLEVDRPPRRRHRDRLPGPPPDDPHLPGARRRPRRSSGWSPGRPSGRRSPSCSPATPRSPPAGSRTTR